MRAFLRSNLGFWLYIILAIGMDSLVERAYHQSWWYAIPALIVFVALAFWWEEIQAKD